MKVTITLNLNDDNMSVQQIGEAVSQVGAIITNTEAVRGKIFETKMIQEIGSFETDGYGE